MHATAPAEPPSPVYEIGGKPFSVDHPHLAAALAAAHASKQYPRCMCVPAGVQMYVARLPGWHGGYLVKRMPNTGSQHAPSCPSFEPPAETSGLGQVLGSAIKEDPATGQTALRLGFPLIKFPDRGGAPPQPGVSDSVSTDGTRLSLRGLLHYLWDQAELTHWRPGFAGKRNWATVRRHLLRAAAGKTVGGGALLPRLYIPEIFSVAESDAINARRLAQWARFEALPGGPQPLMLLIGEVKDIIPARYGFKAVVKHVPDLGFSLDEGIYRRMGRRFETALAMWSARDDIHMLIIATFTGGLRSTPAIQELSLLPATSTWLPVESEAEKLLVDHLVRKSRSFIKSLRYNLSNAGELAVATLTDCGTTAPSLHIAESSLGEASSPDEQDAPQQSGWLWDPGHATLPELPART